MNVSGLLGGHSGDDIEKGHANANKVLNRILWNMYKEMDLRIAKIDGGNLARNDSREASALAVVPYADKEKVRVIFNQVASDIEGEYKDVETNMRLALHSEDVPEETMTKKSTKNC